MIWPNTTAVQRIDTRVRQKTRTWQSRALLQREGQGIPQVKSRIIVRALLPSSQLADPLSS